MELSTSDRQLLKHLAQGLPLTDRPYAEIAAQVGLSEQEVLERSQALVGSALIKRFGIIVRHRQLGYAANAMVVWNIPDADVSRIARRIAAAPFVTLCYRRPRHLPYWPYNLFCMIHGRDEDVVRTHVRQLVRGEGLGGIPHNILFSRRCFKQRGARYGAAP